jgi:hypothetical protein
VKWAPSRSGEVIPAIAEMVEASPVPTATGFGVLLRPVSGTMSATGQSLAPGGNAMAWPLMRVKGSGRYRTGRIEPEAHPGRS